MLIEKYTKQKSGLYKLNLDDGTNVLLHEDVILKYDLLLHKEINQDTLDQALEENTSYLAYDLALNYIKIKMRSKKEIEEYLTKKGVHQELIIKAIATLSQQGYVNDRLYAQSFINDKINLSNDGPFKIKEQLLKLGIDENTILQTIIIFDREQETDRITKIIDKHIKINRNKSNIILKNKLMNYLVQLGYTKELVISMINCISIDDRDILKKEYDKIYEKLSKKYAGKELEYKVKQKLYQKGFYH